MPTSPPPLGRSGRSAYAIAQAVIGDAAALTRARFRTALDVTHKGRGDVVTEVDRAVDRLMTGALTEEYPGWGILSEESPERASDSGYRWIIDPIDGTKNFSQCLPIFAVNLALASNDEVVLGMTCSPMQDELFAAERGRGATLNGAPMHVAARTTVADSVLAYDLGYDNARARLMLEFLLSLWPDVQSLRNIGTSATGLAYVAAGRADLYLHSALSPWDFAPGLLLVQEAGGVVTERDGGPVHLRKDGRFVPNSTGIVAGNPAVHADLLARAGGHPWRWAGLRG